MISKSVSDVLESIAQTQGSYNAWRRTYEDNRRQEADARQRAERDAKEMKELEIKIDELSLELRRVLNGEESTIAVDPPKEADMSAQVGREG